MVARLPRRRVLAALAAGALAPLPAATRGATEDGVLRIAAAADLVGALDEIAAEFGDHADRRALRITYGSTGNLAYQIDQGAPFGLFLAADESFVLGLAKRGRAADKGAVYARGRLALAAHASAGLSSPTMEQLAIAIESGRVRRIAVANPEHAPYGRAAEQAMKATGLWSAAAPRLVLGANVAQAAQFVSTGAAEAGFVAAAFAAQRARDPVLSFGAVPAALHSPLIQRGAVIRPEMTRARRFLAHLISPAARNVLVARYGFDPPE
jgi:molybdate transport system substrate-binding protein